MSTVAKLMTQYVSLYTMLDRMLAGEHRNENLRRGFAEQGKAFLDQHDALLSAPYDTNPASDYALLQACPELRKQVARVASRMEVNDYVASMIPFAQQNAGNEMDKVTEVLNSPDRLKMLRLIRNPAMEELAANATVRTMMAQAGQQTALATLDRLNAADKGKPSVDELPLQKRIELVRQAISAREENQGFFGGVFRSAAAALVPSGLIVSINNKAEETYQKEQVRLEQALAGRVPPPSTPKPPGLG